MVNLKFDAKGLTQYYESFRAENKAIKSNRYAASREVDFVHIV